MAKNLFHRYIWLVDTIYQAGKITFNEINERWLRSAYSDGEPFSKRTFHNHKEAIQDLFDINIGCERKGGYRFYIENVEDIEKEGIRNWLLNTFAVKHLIDESHHLKHRILFEDIPSGRAYLTPIIEAMRDGVEVKIHHQSYWYDEPRDYTVQPYFVKVFKQRWYVIGYCTERKAIRTFALDRIIHMNTTETKYKMPNDFNPQDFFTHNFGIMHGEGEDLAIVRLKVNSYHSKYIRALPLHKSQKETERNNDYSIFEYYLIPTIDFKQELLSMGANVEVITPQGLRDEIKNEIQEMSELYK